MARRVRFHFQTNSWAITLDIAFCDTFKSCPLRLRPRELRLVGPFIDKHERRSLSIILFIINVANEYTIAKMLRQIIPTLHNLHVFKLCLNTPLEEVKQWRADRTPRANTVAHIFNVDLFTLPLLQAFSFEKLTYHCSVFDFNPIPDIAIGGPLRLLTHFKGSLANVNALMTRWDHNLISVSVVGGPSSVDSVDCFRHNIEGSMTLRDLKLQEEGGTCGDSSRFEQLWIEHVLRCMLLPRLRVLVIRITRADDHIEQHIFEEAMRSLIESGLVPKGKQGVLSPAGVR
ncbi:hypothetical protein GG344DRAFT_64107 [Lentinula edodes]|nr:hypothetical protein GG344DRAFT_64107 [Lentinula edodes]